MNDRARIVELEQQLKEMERQNGHLRRANDELFIEVRDQFAMAALTGLLAKHYKGYETTAIGAYAFADAMMKRPRGTPQEEGSEKIILRKESHDAGDKIRRWCIGWGPQEPSAYPGALHDSLPIRSRRG